MGRRKGLFGNCCQGKVSIACKHSKTKRNFFWQLYNIIGSDDDAMFDHSNELIQLINQVVPASVEEPEEEIDENFEIESDDEDAMEE